MATGLFDPAQLDAAVNDAFGIKPSGKAHPFARPPVLEGLNPELNTRLNKAREEYRKQFGQEMPITSGVRSREDQQRLYDRWKAGDKNIFMPVNPADFPNRKTFHDDAIDIPTSVSEDFLKQFGIHRPLGARDPVHAVTMANFGGQQQAAAPAAAPQAAPQTAPMSAPTAAPQAAPTMAPAAPQAPAMAPTAAPTGQTPGQLSVMDLMKPEAIDAAVGEAFGAPPKKGKVAQKVTGLLRESAALADTLYGIVSGPIGLATYAGSRAVGQTPEQAAKTKESVMRVVDQPFGKAAGVTETPEYKGEFTKYVLEQASKVPGWLEGVTGIPLTAKTIAEKTGAPEQEIRYYLELAVLGAPFTKTGRAVAREVGEAAGYVGGKTVDVLKQATPAPVQRAVTRATEAVLPGTTTMPTRAPTLGAPGQVMPGQPIPARPTEGMPTQPTGPMGRPGEQTTTGEYPGTFTNRPYGSVGPEPVSPAASSGTVPPTGPAPTGRGSIGAMGVPDVTMVRQALQTATPEFQKLYGDMPLDKVNTPVVMRHLEADSLPIPVRLTKGQATGDVVQLSKEQNVRGSQQELAYRINEQNKALVDNVPLIREKAAPDVYATKTIESSQALIDSYKALDDARSTEISAAYKALEDAAGGQFPVDGVTLAKNAEAALAKKLKTDFLPTPIKTQLDRFKNGEPMTFEQFEAMRTNLAAEIRKAERSGDGNTAMAASIVREALEQLPLKGEAGKLKPLADNARQLAKARFDALKKDPAYRAAVDDVVPADKFFDKFVVNGVNKNINTMVETLGRDTPAHQHMKAGTINWLSDKAGIVDGKGNFSQANYNKALKKLDDVNNFGAIFDPESQLQLKTLGNVAGYTQFQPRGSFVNNSNTLVGYLANKAAGGAETIGNIVGLKTFGYPLGTEGRRVIRASRERKETAEALKPGAGSTLDEISKKGQ
jgi:hypothetical protein